MKASTGTRAVLLALVLAAGPAAWTAGPAHAQSARDSGLIVVTPEHAAAVDRGLAWLAEHQNSDGSWTAKIGYKLNTGYEYTRDGTGHVGVTALAGLDQGKGIARRSGEIAVVSVGLA